MRGRICNKVGDITDALPVCQSGICGPAQMECGAGRLTGMKGGEHGRIARFTPNLGWERRDIQSDLYRIYAVIPGIGEGDNHGRTLFCSRMRLPSETYC